ncbi:hypothetical protein ACWDYH_23515 [Nocardia goodfellowii]
MSFVYRGNVDEAGPTCGTAGSCYRPAIEAVDRQIGRIISAIQQRPDFDSGEWLFLVTTDHGHTPAGGHGGNSRAERQSFIIAASAGIAPAQPRIEPRIVDVAATALNFLGVARPGLDGVPINEPSADPFDTRPRPADARRRTRRRGGTARLDACHARGLEHRQHGYARRRHRMAGLVLHDR